MSMNAIYREDDDFKIYRVSVVVKLYRELDAIGSATTKRPDPQGVEALRMFYWRVMRGCGFRGLR
jgi:hypothetical protein